MGKFDNFVSLDLGKMAADDTHFGKRSGKRIERFKVAPDTHRVMRILRGANDGSFYRIRSQHWGIPVGHGNTPPLSCARKHGDGTCYFCEEVNQYFNSGDPRQKELAQRMKSSVSVMSNVIDVNDPVNEDGTPKVLIWQYSWKLFQEVRAYFRDADYGDLTHPVTGRNFKISASIVSSQGNRKWTRYDLQVGAKPTELEHPEALNHLYDLDSTFPVKLYTYEEQQMIFDGTWDPRNPGQLPSPDAARPKPKPIASIFKSKEEAEPEAEPEADFESSKSSSSDDEFESSSSADGDDDWSDVLDDVDDDKQKAIRDKLDKLKKAAKKR